MKISFKKLLVHDILRVFLLLWKNIYNNIIKNFKDLVMKMTILLTIEIVMEITKF